MIRKFALLTLAVGMLAACGGGATEGEAAKADSTAAAMKSAGENAVNEMKEEMNAVVDTMQAAVDTAAVKVEGAVTTATSGH
jgi:hypothetical protein